MFNLVLLIVIVAVGVYFKNKYVNEVEIPIIEKNSDLYSIIKFGLVGLITAGLFAFINIKITFYILIGLIPVVLYLNFKTIWLAFNRKNTKNNEEVSDL